MITATAWVPRGYAATFPTKYALDEQELARISRLAQLKLEDANERLEAARGGEEGGGADGEEGGWDDEEEEEEEVEVKVEVKVEGKEDGEVKRYVDARRDFGL